MSRSSRSTTAGTRSCAARPARRRPDEDQPARRADDEAAALGDRRPPTPWAASITCASTCKTDAAGHAAHHGGERHPRPQAAQELGAADLHALLHGSPQGEMTDYRRLIRAIIESARRPLRLS
ncbi:MAG: hypothetical protein M0C28_06370 [Candidatus Moduliflexus flocculans]|nr:hypothetical protein [Candidatus Moduliflexus flocculans]